MLAFKAAFVFVALSAMASLRNFQDRKEASEKAGSHYGSRDVNDLMVDVSGKTEGLPPAWGCRRRAGCKRQTFARRRASTTTASAARQGGRATLNVAGKTLDKDGDSLSDDFEMSCAEKWKPVMYLHSEESFGPSTVESYLSTCTLRKQNKCSTRGSLIEVGSQGGSNATGEFCGHEKAIASRIGWSCRWRDKDETRGSATTKLLSQDKEGTYLRCLGCHGKKCDNMGMGQRAARGVLDEKSLRDVPFYLHVVPDSRFGKGAIQIQYWFFYPFNGPTAKVGIHQGDWEFFSIAVDFNCKKRLAYQSWSHGQPSGWKTEGTGKQEFENGRLVTYSGKNSHAGFMTAGKHNGGTAVSSDYTDRGRRWDPVKMINLGERTCSGDGRKPMPGAEYVDFAGRWGTTSAFDGVLSGNIVGGICPSGPVFQFNKDTPHKNC